jgi:two-component system, LuxR family, response regulator FixJ
MRPDCSTPVAPTEDPLSAAEPTERAANRQGTGRRDRRVYIVEDDASVCDSLVVLLEIYGFETVAYASGAALLADQRHREMGCLIIDQHLPQMDGIEVLTALQREAIFVPTILVSGRIRARSAGLLQSAAHQIDEPAVVKLPAVMPPAQDRPDPWRWAAAAGGGYWWFHSGRNCRPASFTARTQAASRRYPKEGNSRERGQLIEVSTDG